MEVVLRAVVLGDDSFGGGEVFSFYDVVHADGEVPPRSLKGVLVVLVVIRQVVHQIKLRRRQRVDGVVFEFIQHFDLFDNSYSFLNTFTELLAKYPKIINTVNKENIPPNPVLNVPLPWYNNDIG
eukprot:CAMPEP_0202959564 /NCGR_PEP_ID=MMETSP1396-20130829/3738_1 /ASSEMBLY_ACC=CAM_ASM_000872 /TAXON_ID= /ORGANISM="Pseudokeronopsis sp., Strain Brazil" /LENGTH=124 /DNA_ID=CAMNT_0049678185 /DNA_START=1479 /DNA_END=1854 /DNA_ORIENTATION=+